MIAAEQSHQIIGRQSRHITDWKSCYAQIKTAKKETEGLVAKALQNQEEDRLTLEGMQDKMSQVNEFETKLKASEYEVVTLQTELLQVRE